MTHALPALLVALTALVTSALVHAGYAIWWLFESIFRPMSYDWNGALALSGIATAVVLLVGLIVRRLVAAHRPPVSPEQAPGRPLAAGVAVRTDR
ncbi:MAG TPA: hypothetical protein VEC60_19950 [Reyranella sp.]|nr:hypothetical protein [Reyranella sp.]